MNRFVTLFCGLAACAMAHVMSMSSGDLTIQGSHAHYELRMPLYEIAHVQHPEQVRLDHVKFAGARTTSRGCHTDPLSDAYVCVADYAFPAPVEDLEVDCRLAAATVPTHVHVLHAQLGTRRQEAVFD